MGFPKIKNSYTLIEDSPIFDKDLYFLDDVSVDDEVIASKLTKKLGPGINNINKALNKIRLQQSATSQHKKIVAKKDFEKEIFEQLTILSKKLR